MDGTYEDLQVWQAAMDLNVKVYRVSQGFPADQRYGLTGQLRRAAGSRLDVRSPDAIEIATMYGMRPNPRRRICWPAPIESDAY